MTNGLRRGCFCKAFKMLREAMAGIVLLMAMSVWGAFPTPDVKFVSWLGRDFFDFKIKELEVKRQNATLGVCGKAEYGLDGLDQTDKTLFVKVFFDYDGDGQWDQSRVDEKPLGWNKANPHHLDISFCSGIPESAGHEISVRVVIGVRYQPEDPCVLKGFPGAYKDATCVGFYEPPETCRPNIGTYANGQYLRDDIAAQHYEKLRPNNSVIAGENFKIYPVFSMTKTMHDLILSKPSAFAIVIKMNGETHQYGGSYGPKLQQDVMGGYKAYERNGEIYGLYTTESPIVLPAPRFSANAKDYGRKELEIGYKFTEDIGCGKIDELKPWIYFLLFSRDKSVNDEPAWFHLWKQGVADAKSYKYDVIINGCVSRWVGEPRVDDFALSLPPYNDRLTSGGVCPITWKSVVTIGPGVLTQSMAFKAGSVNIDDRASYDRFRDICLIEKSKSEVVKSLHECKIGSVVLGVPKLNKNEICDDNDRDYVADTLEMPDFYGTSPNKNDTFSVLKSYRWLCGPGDLEYVARTTRLGDDFGKEQWMKMDWSYPSERTQLIKHAEGNSHQLKNATLAAASGMGSRTIDEDEYEVYELKADYGIDGDFGIAFEGARETTVDFENGGLSFAVDVIVDREGEYETQGYLTDDSGNPVACATSRSALSVGSSTVSLSFAPDVIARFAALHKGPWELAIVSFEGTDSDGAHSCQATRVTTCKTVDYSRRCCRTSSVVASGRCTSTAGANQLNVSLPLLFPFAGTYVVSASLSDAAESRALSVFTVTNTVSEGSSTVDLGFPLADLAAAKKNGSFYLGQVNVQRLEGGVVVHEDVLLPNYETIEYDAEDQWALSGARILNLEPGSMSVSFEGNDVAGYGYAGATLSLSFECNEKMRGKTVRFDAELSDTNGMLVATTRTTHFCDDVDDYSGEWSNHEIAFFTSADIAEAQSDGPYAVTRIVATDETTGEKLDECRPHDLWTEPVLLTELASRGPVPSGLDGLSVRLVRVGGARKISKLFLDIPTENAFHSDVEGTAVLTNSAGYFVCQAASEYIPDKDNRGVLRLSFDGAAVRASGRDGPYAVSDIEIWSSSLPDVHHVVEQTYATDRLLASDFTSSVMSFAPFDDEGEFDGSQEKDYAGALFSADGSYEGTVSLSCGRADSSGACVVRAVVDKNGESKAIFTGTTKDGRAQLRSEGSQETFDIVIGNVGFSGELGLNCAFGTNVADVNIAPFVGSWTVISAGFSFQLKIEDDCDAIGQGSGDGYTLRGRSKAFAGGADRVCVPLVLSSADGVCRASALLQIDASGHVEVVGKGVVREGPISAGFHLSAAGRTERPEVVFGYGDQEGKVGETVDDFELKLNDLSYPCVFRAEGLPRGLFIDAQTGCISGSPQESCERTVVVAITSLADATWETRAEFNLEVAALPADVIGSYRGKLSARSGDVSTVVIYPSGQISGVIYLPSGCQTSFSVPSFWYWNVYGGVFSAAMYVDVDDNGTLLQLSFYHDEGELTCSGNFDVNGEWMEVGLVKENSPLPTVSVAYDAHGGTCSQTVSADVVKGTPVGILPDAERAGYGFQGWYTQATGGALVGPEELMLSNTVLHAHWLPNTYVVHFDANGGTGEMDNQIMTYDADAHLPLCEFSRRGHVFAGWNIGEPAQDDGDAPGLTADGAEVKNLTAEANGHVTLYAAWDEIEDLPPVYIRDGILIRYDDPIVPGESPAIPSEVRAIGDGCFALASNLTSVVIPESVTNIGPYAFFGCSNLETVVFHEGLVSIDSGAFAQCVSLGEIALPSSVRRVGDALAPTNAVAAVVRSADGEWQDSTNFVETVDGKSAVHSQERSVDVHAWSLVNRGLGAFDGCCSLTNAILNEGLARLGAATFRECVSLTELDVPQSVVHVGGQVVLCSQSMSQQQSRDVDSLQVEGCPASVLSFDHDERRETMTVVRIDAGFLEGCVSLERVRLPQGLEILGARAFAGCGLLREVDLPDSLRALDRGTFCCCSGLERVGLPANLEVIGRGEMPFEWVRTYRYDMERRNGGPASVLTEELVESVADGVATSMVSVNGGSWRIVTAEDHDMRYRPEDGVFYGCAALRELELPATVRTLCDYSFADCGGLLLTFDGPPPTCGTNAVADCQVGFYLPELSDRWSPVIADGLWNGLEMRELSDEPPPATSHSQDLTLSGLGWHEVSFAVLPEGGDPADVFAPVEDKIGYVTYGSLNWNPETGGTLTALEIGKGYWVQTTADTVSWTVTGHGNPDVEIPLKPGWNLIGYPLLEEGEIETVLATALATEKIDFIYSGSRVYPGTLTKMSPGKGYWVYANAAVTIRFDAE